MNVEVGKLTVRAARRGAGRDAGLRVRTESRLRSLDLHPAGLPGHAILIVRRLELPAVDRATAQQARTALSRLRQAAVRPAAGPVADGAPAVLFRDEVELLACLTADLVRGVAGQRWYWRRASLAQAAGTGWPSGPGAALAAAWLRDVRWLPGCLARLPGPEVQQAVALLSPPDVARVLRALLSTFGVPDQPGPPGPELNRPPPGPPWRRWLRPTPLLPEAEALWGVALSLYHAPAVVRGAGYAGELAAWRTAASPVSCRPAPAGGTPAEGTVAARDRTERGPAEDSRAEDSRAERDPVELGAGRDTPAAADQARAGRGEPGRDGKLVWSHGFGGERPGRAAGGAGRRAAGAPPAGGEQEAGAPARIPAWADEGIVTRLASMLFLVNFVVWLDDRADRSWPGGWALVELLGRYLLGGRLPGLADDPLWDVLAALDGRLPGTVPVVGIGPADPLRLPAAWLERWPPPASGYVARRAGQRLVIEHPEAGFVAADVPCPAGAFDEVLAAEAAWLGDIEGAAALPDGRDDPGRRFGEAAGGFAGWLLRSRGIGASALAAPGRVLVTGTHVDAVLRLQDIDLTMRVAGLDRDPGWVPELGRIVLFHFMDAT